MTRSCMRLQTDQAEAAANLGTAGGYTLSTST
jgi:hypothetical protein